MADKDTDGAPSGSVQIDWENDLCWLIAHSIAVQNHTMYVMGGHMALVPEKQSLLDDKEMGNGHLRILDFSRSFDLSRDKITKVIRLDRHVPVLWRPHLFANNNGLYQFGLGVVKSRFFNDTGYILSQGDRLHFADTKVFRFDIDHDAWDLPWEGGLGQETPMDGLVAADHAAEVGWVYGGLRSYKSLVRFDMHRKEKPVGEIMKTVNREVVPQLSGGELLFLRGLGKEGMLVVIGGEVDSTMTDAKHTINVYDIASKTWFRQETSPASDSNSISSAFEDSERSYYCAIAVSARDNSSHNIYMYGGEIKRAVRGDMWILSLPSFTWIGPVTMGGVDVVGGSTKLDYHRCATMQNQYMVVYQGRDWDALGPACNPHGGVRLFDLQTMEWTTRYEFSSDPAPYRVPKVVYNVIGGDENGGATLTLPQAHVDPTLKEILAPGTGTPELLPSSTPEPPSDPVFSLGVLIGSILGSLIAGAALISWVLYLWRRNNQHAAPPSDEAASGSAERYMKPELEAAIPNELAAHPVEALVGYSNEAQDIVWGNFELVELPEDTPPVCHELGRETPCQNYGSEVVYVNGGPQVQLTR
ncbi:hypothetical protein BDZ91DRAFT_794625 [Kalaharituber pfeilii]|nr:hypothetical protein BDZ91DRAFT_794625 [Kalaharituber pfeilii]